MRLVNGSKSITTINNNIMMQVIASMKPIMKEASTLLMRRLMRGFNSWSCAIRKAASSSYSNSHYEALNLYTQMHRQSIPFDSFSILFTLKSLSSTHLHLHNNLSLIHHLHAHVLKLGFSSHVYVSTSLLHSYILFSASSLDPARLLFDEIPHKNTVTWNTMITGYAKSGDVLGARTLFDQMPLRDLASWSAMIAAYINNAHWETGLGLFRQMMLIELLKPDQVTLGSILAGCGHMGSIGFSLGKAIHGFVTKNCWGLNVELGTVLVDMYAKCGFLKKACLVFNMMQDRNVMSWTALICGSAQHGYGKEALSIFERMKASGIRPNELTFTGILSACVQARLVEEGRRYFEMIEEEYGMKPRIQHYGCLVDLYGKAGLIGEAYQVIKTMRIEPNVVVWSSFLSACKVHRQFEKIAERAIEEVLGMLKPENDGGVYSLICDLYVCGGRLDEAERVRNMMIKENVKKARGSSFIQSGGSGIL